MLGRYLIQSAAGNAEAAESYWFATIGGTGDDASEGVAVDSTGAVYVVGYVEVSGEAVNAQIVKYNSSGTLQWQRDITNGSNTDRFYRAAIDSSDNIYVAGISTFKSLLVKYNSSGTIQWQKSLEQEDGGGFKNVSVTSVDVDSSGNVYIVGNYQPGNQGSVDTYTAKYNSSGTVQWQRGLGFGSRSIYPGRTIHVDGSGDIVIGDQEDTASRYFYKAGAAKYNSSGTLQWKKKMEGSFTNPPQRGRVLGTDSSDNIYFADMASFTIYVWKTNSSGTVQWTRELNKGSGIDDEVNDIAVTSSGDVYIVGETDISGTSVSEGLIVKFNSSGTLQYARTFGSEAHTGSTRFRGIQLDDNDNMFISGETEQDAVGQRDFIVVKLPIDGSLTGTYGNFEYASQSRTTTSQTLTSSDSSLTAYTSSLSAATETYTEAATSLTNTTTTI